MLSSDQLRTSCNMSTPTQIGYFFAHKITCSLFPFLLSSDEQMDPEHHFHVNRSCHLIEQPSCGVNCCSFFFCCPQLGSSIVVGRVVKIINLLL
jgi:hypothetical protein